MHNFITLIIIATFITLHTQGMAAGTKKDAGHGSKTTGLTTDELCAQLTLDEVNTIMGKKFERRLDTEKLYQGCTYGDSTEKGRLQVSYFSLGNSRLQKESFRKFVESEAKGKIVERDGLLVSHFRRNNFGTDSIWFEDRQGHALELNVNSGISEDQAVALVKAAMD
ncbi:MAG: hypothetical protein KKB30_05180 [Proteobacteria bacterium]|nr:hypothetical protein [Pseudomonadota bacterium]MBU1714610.1 hypothetical protein [Pseudomonadota bacterium]